MLVLFVLYTSEYTVLCALIFSMMYIGEDGQLFCQPYSSVFVTELYAILRDPFEKAM